MEMVRLNVDVILLATPAAVPAVQRAYKTIPIVMGYSTDPVGNGFVASLARPGGNATGLASSSRRSPRSSWNCSWRQHRVLPASACCPIRKTRAAGRCCAQPKGPREPCVSICDGSTPDSADIDQAFETLSTEGIGAVMVASDALFHP